MPKLIRLPEGTVLCNNEFSEKSDCGSSEELPPLQGDERENKEYRPRQKQKVSVLFCLMATRLVSCSNGN